MPELSYANNVQRTIEHYGPLCVGIDPHPQLLEQWGVGNNLAGLKEFCFRVTQACIGTVGIVKPQVAFFEQWGSAGMAILEETLAELHEHEILTIADAKRGDIGSTMAGYAAAWFPPQAPLSSSALTLTPYVGFEALRPAFDMAAEHGKGVFVLAATSNPEARGLQASTDTESHSVSQQIVDQVRQANAHYGLGHIGIVVGATLNQAPDLSDVGGPILMPGVGAQGASFADAFALAGAEAVALPNVSRSVLCAGGDIEDLRLAIHQAVQECAAANLGK